MCTCVCVCVRACVRDCVRRFFTQGCWPPRLALRACPLRLIPRDNPPHQAGRPNCWAPRRVSPADNDSESSSTGGTRPGYGRAARPIPTSGAHEALPPVIPFLRYVQYALKGGCRWVRDKLNHSIQERDPCGVRMQLTDPVLGGYCCLRDGPSQQRNTPGDHGTVPVRRTYASLEDDGPFRGQPSSRGHRLNLNC